MAKKRDAKRDERGAEPKQLRKRLGKAEDRLQDAMAKRDRAQAHAEALAIIADEIRAQLAELERSEPSGVQHAEPAEGDGSARATKPPAAARAARGTTRRARSKEPTVAKGSPAVDGPAEARATGASSD
jgi:hypothetical protein